MCQKIKCDGKSWKIFGFRGQLNNALAFADGWRPDAARMKEVAAGTFCAHLLSSGTKSQNFWTRILYLEQAAFISPKACLIKRVKL